MKTKILISLFFLLLMASCNLPVSKATPSANIIATRVAQTLAAQPSLTSLATQGPLPTLEITTPPPTETVTATFTPTKSAEDPKNSLGKPDFQDTFSSGNAFGVAGSPYIDEAVRISMQNGAINFASLAINAGNRWRLTSSQPRNFYLEGTFKTISCSGFDQYGLVFRAPSYGDGYGYYFGVSCNGQYQFQRWDSSDFYNTVDWTFDSHILPGMNQTNRIAVKVEDDSFKLYINGTLINELLDSGIPAGGHFGAFVTAKEDVNFTVNLEELLEWNLP
ncbi:MAG: hypothetical protein NTZ74_07195 [Chloroflexi bacterium]|nr:hypothetical protein [Chloroflexota bacterium]